MGNTHVPLAGSHPSKALAREDLPEPVGPTITIRGLGNWLKASGRRVNTSRSLVGSMMPTQLKTCVGLKFKSKSENKLI